MTSGERAAPLAGAVLALDIDGVLIDPKRGGRGPWMRALAEHRGVDVAELQPTFFKKHWPDVLAGKVAIESALATAIGELGWTMDVEDLLQRWFEADFVIDTEVVAAANGWAADGARVVLATNQEHRRAHFLRDRLGALIPVSGFVYSAEVGYLKDDARFYPAASRILGLPPHDPAVVFVDDSYKNAAAAREYGWSAVHFTRQPGWQDEIGAALAQAAAARAG